MKDLVPQTGAGAAYAAAAAADDLRSGQKFPGGYLQMFSVSVHGSFAPDIEIDAKFRFHDYGAARQFALKLRELLQER